MYMVSINKNLTDAFATVHGVMMEIFPAKSSWKNTQVKYFTGKISDGAKQFAWFTLIHGVMTEVSPVNSRSPSAILIAACILSHSPIIASENVWSIEDPCKESQWKATLKITNGLVCFPPPKKGIPAESQWKAALNLQTSPCISDRQEVWRIIVKRVNGKLAWRLQTGLCVSPAKYRKI